MRSLIHNFNHFNSIAIGGGVVLDSIINKKKIEKKKTMAKIFLNWKDIQI